MVHDIATLAAYLAGELAGDERDAVERHLLTCDTCWADIEQARRGQELVQRAYEPYPESLRTRLRDTIGVRVNSQGPHPACADAGVPVRPRRPWRASVVGVAAALVLAVTAVAISSATPTRTGPVAAAVTGYADRRLPGTTLPTAHAPDLG